MFFNNYYYNIIWNLIKTVCNISQAPIIVSEINYLNIVYVPVWNWTTHLSKDNKIHDT